METGSLYEERKLTERILLAAKQRESETYCTEYSQDFNLNNLSERTGGRMFL